MIVRPMQAQDGQTVLRIYEEGIASGIATFEKTAPNWEIWDASHLKNGRFVAVEGDEILGWTALTPVSSRCVYEGVAEVSVYVSQMARGKGIGLALLQKLIETSEEQRLWTLQSSIFAENQASIQLHLKAGFRIVGVREKIGRLDSVWHDNVLMERRSKMFK